MFINALVFWFSIDCDIYMIHTSISVTNPTQYKPVALFSEDVIGLLNGQVTLQCVFSG